MIPNKVKQRIQTAETLLCMLLVPEVSVVKYLRVGQLGKQSLKGEVMNVCGAMIKNQEIGR